MSDAACSQRSSQPGHRGPGGLPALRATTVWWCSGTASRDRAASCFSTLGVARRRPAALGSRLAPRSIPLPGATGQISLERDSTGLCLSSRVSVATHWKATSCRLMRSLGYASARRCRLPSGRHVRAPDPAGLVADTGPGKPAASASSREAASMSLERRQRLVAAQRATGVGRAVPCAMPSPPFHAPGLR